MFTTPSTTRHTHSLVRGVVPAVLVVAVALAACGGTAAPTAGSTDTTGPPSHSVVPDVAAGPVSAEPAALVTASRVALEEVLQRTGALAIVPDAVARVVELEADQRAAAELGGGGRATATAGFGEARRAGAIGEAASLGMGILWPAIDMALGKAADRPDPPEVQPEPGEDHVTIDGGDIDIRYGSTDSITDAAGATVTVSSVVEGALSACPDTSGTVVGRLATDVTIETALGGRSSSASYVMTIDLRVAVDDQAVMAGVDFTVAGSAGESERVAGDGSATIEGYYVEGGSSATLTGSASNKALRLTAIGGPGITRASTTVTADQAQTFVNQQHEIARLALSLVLIDVEKFWRSGACVDVVVTPASDPNAVEGGEPIDLDITATAVADGSAITGTMEPVAAGAGTVSPGGPSAVPGVVTYTAPADASAGTVDVEVRSRRGIGRASIALAGPNGFVADGALDVFRATGTKCGGADGDWSLSLTANLEGASFTGTIAFTLDPATLRGTYVLEGVTTGYGLTIPQRGTGAVWFVAGADGAGQLVFEGVARAGGPSATKSLDVAPNDAPCA